MSELLTEDTLMRARSVLNALGINASADSHGTGDVGKPLDPLAFCVAVMIESRLDMTKASNLERGSEEFSATVVAMCHALRTTRQITGKSFLEAASGHVAPIDT
jgi:hypothetical protein